MPKSINSQVYISYSELSALQVVSSGHLLNQISQKHKNFQSIKDPEDRRCTLVAYDTLPKKFKASIIDKLGDPYAIVEAHALDHEIATTDNLKPDISTHWKIDPQEYKEISSLDIWDKTDPATPSKIMTLSKAGAICKWYNSVKPSQTDKYGYENKPALLKAIQEHPDVKAMDGFWVASDRFQRKFVAYKKEGIKGLVSKKVQNKNNLKLKDEAQKEVLRRL